MNMVLSKNVRTLREEKHWTQHHLADVAGVTLRTIQRVEAGLGASVETLGALANAFDVGIDFLQTDMEAVVNGLHQAYEAFAKTHDLVAMAPVTCSADLELVGRAEALSVLCATDDNGARDVFAALHANLTDMSDIWNEVDPSHHREWVKGAFDQVEDLNRLGLVVCVGLGLGGARVGADRPPVMFRTVYVVAWPAGQERAFLAVERVERVE